MWFKLALAAVSSLAWLSQTVDAQTKPAAVATQSINAPSNMAATEPAEHKKKKHPHHHCKPEGKHHHKQGHKRRGHHHHSRKHNVQGSVEGAPVADAGAAGGGDGQAPKLPGQPAQAAQHGPGVVPPGQTKQRVTFKAVNTAANKGGSSKTSTTTQNDVMTKSDNNGAPPSNGGAETAFGSSNKGEMSGGSETGPQNSGPQQSSSAQNGDRSSKASQSSGTRQAECKKTGGGGFGVCTSECSIDDDCRNPAYKCCSNGCGRTCVRPDSSGDTNSQRTETTQETASFENPCATVRCPEGKQCIPSRKACFAPPCPQYACESSGNGPDPRGPTSGGDPNGPPQGSSGTEGGNRDGNNGPPREQSRVEST